MLDLLDLSIGKNKREPTADEKLAALSRDSRRRRKILQDAWAESQRIDTVKHAKIHGLVGYEMLRRKDEQKRDGEDWFRTLDVTRDNSVDARELIEPMAILGVARDRASVERLANAINEKEVPRALDYISMRCQSIQMTHAEGKDKSKAQLIELIPSGTSTSSGPAKAIAA